MVSRKSHDSSAWAWERRKSAQVVALRFGAGSIPLGLQDLPDGGGGDRDAERDQFAVDSSVAPGGVVADQAQDQGADRAGGLRSTRMVGSAGAGVALFHEVAVPAQHGVGPDQ
jgi:hypothetical protein